MLSLCLHLSSLNLCLLITVVVVINFGLNCFTNSILAYSHFAHTLFDYKFVLVICKCVEKIPKTFNSLVQEFSFGNL